MPPHLRVRNSTWWRLQFQMEVREQKFLFGLLAACKIEILGFRAFRFLFETKNQSGKLPGKFRGFHECFGRTKKRHRAHYWGCVIFAFPKFENFILFFVLRSDFKILWKFVLSRHNVSAQGRKFCLGTSGTSPFFTLISLPSQWNVGRSFAGDRWWHRHSNDKYF